LKTECEKRKNGVQTDNRSTPPLILCDVMNKETEYKLKVEID